MTGVLAGCAASWVLAAIRIASAGDSRRRSNVCGTPAVATICAAVAAGMFDHVPPPVPPAGTANEFVDGLPIGLGFRVPAIVVSPWSVGGYVCSDVLDHTSLIRLIEARFGVPEPNLSAWRRAACGDITTSLRLPGGPARWLSQNPAVSLAAAEAGFLTAQQEVFDNPSPTIPAVNEPIPEQ